MRFYTMFIYTGYLCIVMLCIAALYSILCNTVIEPFDTTSEIAALQTQIAMEQDQAKKDQLLQRIDDIELHKIQEALNQSLQKLDTDTKSLREKYDRLNGSKTSASEKALLTTEVDTLKAQIATQNARISEQQKATLQAMKKYLEDQRDTKNPASSDDRKIDLNTRILKVQSSIAPIAPTTSSSANARDPSDPNPITLPLDVKLFDDTSLGITSDMKMYVNKQVASMVPMMMGN